MMKVTDIPPDYVPTDIRRMIKTDTEIRVEQLEQTLRRVASALNECINDRLIDTGSIHPDGQEIVIAWDAEAVTPEQYATLVAAIGDLVRAHGGIGVKLYRAKQNEP